MNIWTKKSIELANQNDYLDLLQEIYPMSINPQRELSQEDIKKITKSFNNKNTKELLTILLKQEIFPIKDSYVAYLKRDKSAIERNPKTVERLTEMLYDMGLNEILDKTTEPKETNRQIGPLFKNWINTGVLGCKLTLSEEEFFDYNGNIVFNSSDKQMQALATKYLGYNRNKGLDFIGKFNDKYIIGEAKFLTDFGGHQNAQFSDAISTMTYPLEKTNYDVKCISILDGVLYIPGKHKMYIDITQNFDDEQVIISAILLKDYLFSI